MIKIIQSKYEVVIICIAKLFTNIIKILYAFSLMSVISSLSENNKAIFLKSILFMITTIIVQNILYFINIYLDKRFIRKNMICLKEKTFNSIFQYNIEEFSKKSIKEYTSILLNDLSIIENRFFGSLISLLDSITMIICSCIGVIYISPWFLLAFPITMLICIYFPKIFDKKIQKLNEDIINNNVKYTGIADEQLRGFKTIKSFNISSFAEEERNNVIEDLEKSKEMFSRFISIANSTLSIFAIILIFCIYYFGGNLVLKGSITLSGLIALNQILSNIINSCIFLPQHVQMMNSAKSVVNRCFEIINYKNTDTNLHIPNKNYNITLSDVSYKYDKNNESTINGVSLLLEHGKKYAIIGQNGSGKSTLIQLLAGHLKNYTGSIKFDNYEQKEISRQSLYSQIAYMSQEVFMFDKSLNDNINIFNELDQNCYDNIINILGINSIKDKYTSKNNHSLTLSGGEKQKIALARVLLRNASIILADEPTSALDTIASSEFEQFLLSLNDKMCIVITHDIDEHLNNYDAVIVIENGKIIEVGKYSELEYLSNFSICADSN